MTLTKITVHDFNGQSAGDVYDQTQTDDAIKDGDVLNLGGGNVAILMNAWPTIVVGEIEHFHRLKSDVTFETVDGGKYAASAAKAKEVSYDKGRTELPPIESKVSVRMNEGVIVTGVVTGHGQKDGNPTFDFP